MNFAEYKLLIIMQKIKILELRSHNPLELLIVILDFLRKEVQIGHRVFVYIFLLNLKMSKGG